MLRFDGVYTDNIDHPSALFWFNKLMKKYIVELSKEVDKELEVMHSPIGEGDSMKKSLQVSDHTPLSTMGAYKNVSIRSGTAYLTPPVKHKRSVPNMTEHGVNKRRTDARG